MQSLSSSVENVAQSVELQNCLDVSERLVEQEVPTDLEGRGPAIATSGTTRSFMGRLLNAISPTSGLPATANVTERRHRTSNTIASEDTQQTADETELPLQGQMTTTFQQKDGIEEAATRLAKAKAAHAIAELEAAADEATARGAIARRQTAAAILEIQQFERALEKSRSSSPTSVPAAKVHRCHHTLPLKVHVLHRDRPPHRRTQLPVWRGCYNRLRHSDERKGSISRLNGWRSVERLRSR